MITTSDEPTLCAKLNEWYNEAAVDAVEGWIGQKLFDCSETDWQTYTYLILYGAAKFDRVAQGAQLPVATTVEGKNGIALFKSSLINGENLIAKAKATLKKIANYICFHLQRLSEMTMPRGIEAIVRTV